MLQITVLTLVQACGRSVGGVAGSNRLLSFSRAASNFQVECSSLFLGGLFLKMIE